MLIKLETKLYDYSEMSQKDSNIVFLQFAC